MDFIRLFNFLRCVFLSYMQLFTLLLIASRKGTDEETENWGMSIAYGLGPSTCQLPATETQRRI